MNDVKVLACREHVTGTPHRLLQQGNGEWAHTAIMSLGLETVSTHDSMLSADEMERRYRA